MTKTMTLMCAAVSAVALYAAPANAAPLSGSLAFQSVDTQDIEAVRYHRRHHGRAYYGGYNSFAFAPGYAGRRYYGGVRRGGHSCARDEDELYSAYPSWWCSRIRPYM
jgi:hypothetical protein